MDTLPRFVRGANDATVYDTSKGFLDPISSPEDFYARSGSHDIAGNTTVVPDVSQFLSNYYRSQATKTYQPTLDNTINGLNLNLNALDKNAADTSQAYSDAGQTALEKQNALGLLPTGGTGALIAKNESDKANALAGIALQRAGVGVQKAQAQTNNEMSINDMVSKLLAGSDAAKEAATSPAQSIDLGNRVILLNKAGQVIGQYAKGLAPGSGTNNGGGIADILTALLGGGAGGTGGGQAGAQMNKDQIVTELQNEFKANPGGWAGNDSAIIQRIADLSGGAITPQDAATIYYQTRKPFELQNPFSTNTGPSWPGPHTQSAIHSLFPGLFSAGTPGYTPVPHS